MKNGLTPAKSRGRSPDISAVIFDYGKVLAHSATPEGFGRMASILNVSFEEFYPLWESTRDNYDRGDLTPEEYWLTLAAQTQRSLDRGQIEVLRKIEVEIWSHVDQSMLDWVRQLRSAGVKTALLSNMPRDLVAHLRTNSEWMENFAFKTFSSEVKLIKPEPAIYEYTLRALKVSASEALFIDDREKNVKAARALGIHGIQFQSVTQLKRDLEAIGFPMAPAVSSQL